MTRITLNEMIQWKKCHQNYFVNAIDKGNAKTPQLLRTLIKEVQASNRKQNHVAEHVLQTIFNNSAGISTVIQEGFEEVENRNVEKGKIDTNANKIKQHISTLWENTLNSRKQAIFQY